MFLILLQIGVDSELLEPVAVRFERCYDAAQQTRVLTTCCDQNRLCFPYSFLRFITSSIFVQCSYVALPRPFVDRPGPHVPMGPGKRVLLWRFRSRSCDNTPLCPLLIAIILVLLNHGNDCRCRSRGWHSQERRTVRYRRWWVLKPRRAQDKVRSLMFKVAWTF